MGLPAKLKNMNVFADGDSYLGVVSEMKLPPLKLKTEEWRGGGMLGPVDIAMGLEKLESEEKYGGLVVGVLRKFGQVAVDGTQLRFVGAYQDDRGVLAAELTLRGMLTEVDPGNAKVNDNTEWSFKRTISYLKWTVNGRDEVEIDLLNNIFIVDGIDHMAEIRAALQQ